MSKERTKIIATNIKKYVKEAGITQKELAKAIDISPSTLSDYLNLRSNPSYGVIQRIADYFGVAKSDIDTTYKVDTEQNKLLDIYNQLEPPRQDKVYDYAEHQLEEQNNMIQEVYLVGQTAAGTGVIYGDTQYDEIKTTVPKGADYALTVKGDSMEPTIEDGSIIFYREQPVLENGEIGIIEINREEVTCKKFYAEDDKYILRSINPKYDDMVFTDNIRIIGKVIL